MPSAPGAKECERWWLIPGLVAVCLVAVTPVFWCTDLDLRVARWFIDADAGQLHDRWFWQAAYRLPGLLAWVWGLCGLGLLLAAWRLPQRRHLARIGLYLLLVLALGPGLVVNGILKDHWGRPRPVQTQELGGDFAYAPPWQKGPAGRGKSFPSGHVSVPAMVLGLWLLCRRRRQRLANACLALGLSATVWVGCVRMLAGGHYLSDVLWSAGLVFLIAAVTQRILRLPETCQAGTAGS